MSKFPAAALLALTIAFVISPAFTTPFSGFEANQLPIPQINPPVQPAGYTFSIWGLIYGWLIVSAIFGLFKRAEDLGWARARGPMIVSIGLGVPWLAIANTNAIWATVTIMAMAAAAITAFLRAPMTDRWWFQAPTGIYAGWLTAASCVSLGATAAGYGFLLGPVGWAILAITIAFLVAVTVYRARPAAEYPLTIVWALAGVVVGNGGPFNAVGAYATVGIIALLSAIVFFRGPEQDRRIA